jgi:hypothetical protein
MLIARRSNRTDRFRPEAEPGSTVEGLSLPQQDDNNDPAAEQKHQVTPECYRQADMLGEGLRPTSFYFYLTGQRSVRLTSDHTSDEAASL